MDKLKSRKFWIGLVAMLIPFLAQFITGEVAWRDALAGSMLAAAATIGALAHEDAAKHKAAGAVEVAKVHAAASLPQENPPA